MTRRRRRAVHPHRHGVRRPGRRVVAAAARPTYGPTAAGLGTQVRALVFNVMFVEYVFFLPGFLWFTKRAIGSDPPKLHAARRHHAVRSRRAVGGARGDAQPARRRGDGAARSPRRGEGRLGPTRRNRPDTTRLREDRPESRLTC